MSFPKNFLWGAATAAYQIEGAVNEDGRKPCIWDSLSKGHVVYDETGENACDHYHRFEEDIKLMKEIGLKCYRFSVAWPRIIPDGTGTVNEKGIEFYVNLVKLLKENDIEPIVTLYHWDLPYSLYLKGGWTNADSQDWFLEYTKFVVKALSPYVKYFLTFNEPQCFIGISYVGGAHAPFLDEPSSLLPATRNVLLAHGKAVKLIREFAPKAKVGFAPTGAVYAPHNNTDYEYKKAYELTFSDRRGPFSVAWWCDPVFKGSITPRAASTMNIAPEDFMTDEEWKIVTEKLDFLGFNFYQCDGIQENGQKYPDNTFCGGPVTAMNWPITPEGMYYTVRFLSERYQRPIIITENGMANIDFVMLDGKVHDPQRIDYVHRYLLSLEKAINEGIEVIGYNYWSLMDNFEWAEGYKYRFGLIYVDYRTQKRTLKDSAFWYKNVIETNGSEL